MEINTKFKLGDRVWLMYENEAVTADVKSIQIDVHNSGVFEAETILVSYELDMGVCSDKRYFTSMECKLFATKEELRDALFQ